MILYDLLLPSWPMNRHSVLRRGVDSYSLSKLARAPGIYTVHQVCIFIEFSERGEGRRYIGGRRGKRRTPRGGTSRERGERNTDFKTDREGRGIVQGLESIIVQGLKTRNKGLGYIGVKLRVQGAGCRVWGIGLRVKG